MFRFVLGGFGLNLNFDKDEKTQNDRSDGIDEANVSVVPQTQYSEKLEILRAIFRDLSYKEQLKAAVAKDYIYTLINCPQEQSYFDAVVAMKDNFNISLKSWSIDEGLTLQEMAKMRRAYWDILHQTINAHLQVVKEYKFNLMSNFEPGRENLIVADTDISGSSASADAFLIMDVSSSSTSSSSYFFELGDFWNEYQFSVWNSGQGEGLPISLAQSLVRSFGVPDQKYTINDYNNICRIVRESLAQFTIQNQGKEQFGGFTDTLNNRDGQKIVDLPALVEDHFQKPGADVGKLFLSAFSVFFGLRVQLFHMQYNNDNTENPFRLDKSVFAPIWRKNSSGDFNSVVLFEREKIMQSDSFMRLIEKYLPTYSYLHEPTELAKNPGSSVDLLLSSVKGKSSTSNHYELLLPKAITDGKTEYKILTNTRLHLRNFPSLVLEELPTKIVFEKEELSSETSQSADHTELIALPPSSSSSVEAEPAPAAATTASTTLQEQNPPQEPKPKKRSSYQKNDILTLEMFQQTETRGGRTLRQPERLGFSTHFFEKTEELAKRKEKQTKHGRLSLRIKEEESLSDTEKRLKKKPKKKRSVQSKNKRKTSDELDGEEDDEEQGQEEQYFIRAIVGFSFGGPSGALNQILIAFDGDPEGVATWRDVDEEVVTWPIYNEFLESLYSHHFGGVSIEQSDCFLGKTMVLEGSARVNVALRPEDCERPNFMPQQIELDFEEELKDISKMKLSYQIDASTFVEAVESQKCTSLKDLSTSEAKDNIFECVIITEDTMSGIYYYLSVFDTDCLRDMDKFFAQEYLDSFQLSLSSCENDSDEMVVISRCDKKSHVWSALKEVQVVHEPVFQLGTKQWSTQAKDLATFLNERRVAHGEEEMEVEMEEEQEEKEEEEEEE